jgi:hypothetical protein
MMPTGHAAGEAAPALHAPMANAGAVADVGTLSWVNVLLGSIWPKANMALMKYVHDQLTPRLRETLPGPFRGLRFARFTLGKNVPEFGPIEVRRISETHVQVELHMRYFSDVDILIETGTAGISFGVNHLAFVGRLCIALKPLLSTSPVIGGVHVFFASPPHVELKFAGLALAVSEVPGIESKILGVVEDFFRNSMVLPNMRSFHFTKDEGIMDLTEAASHPPVGVLRVRVVRANNLAGANWQMGMVERFTSDPYCQLRLGKSSARTSTIRGSCDPVWPPTDPSAYFVVYHQEQELEISVCQDDQNGFLRGNFNVGSLGRIPATSVHALLHHHDGGDGKTPSNVRIELNTSQVNRGMLHVDDPVNTGVPSYLEIELEWFDLPSSASEADLSKGVQQLQASALGQHFSPLLGGLLRFDSLLLDSAKEALAGPVAVVLVELHGASGVPEDAALQKRSLRWQCKLEDHEPVRSKPGEYSNEDPCSSGLPIHQKLFYVIDRLSEHDMPVPEIASVCDTDQSLIQEYLTRRREFQLEKDARLRETEEHCIDCKWHETLALVVRRPAESCVQIELVEGDGKVVGFLDPVPLQQVLHDGGVFARSWQKLSPAERADAKPGFFAAWLLPCSKPQVASRARYRNLSMQISVRVLPLASSTADAAGLQRRPPAVLAATPRASIPGGLQAAMQNRPLAMPTG